MDYEKKYNNTLELARDYHKANLMLYKADENAVLEDIFPELAESEDEKTRKELTEFLEKASGGFLNTTIKCKTFGKWLAWLEKQGDKSQGKLVFESAKEEKVDNANKAEPKFKVEKGKWYVCIKDLLDNYANKAFYKGDTYLSTRDGSLIPCNSNVPFDVEVCSDMYFREWTIADAKEGDVLASDNGIIMLVKESRDSPWGYRLSYHCAVLYDGTFEPRDFHVVPEKFFPATKEQRDRLFQKMKEAGYIWDAEKKKPKKIEPKFKVGDIMRTLQEAKDGYTDGLPVVVSIDNEYYHCTNELIAIKDQDGYEFPSISIKPKFKVGDWVVDTIIGGVWHIDSINKEYYKVSDGRGNDNDCPIIRQDEIHLWTIEDAKDGDILASNYNRPFIYNGNHNSRHVGSHCGITTNDKLIIASEECHWTENLNIHPANKDQRDILMNAMNDDGYVFDFDKKELKKKIYLSAKHNSQPIKPTDE